jgi:hypothetical protein
MLSFGGGSRSCRRIEIPRSVTTISEDYHNGDIYSKEVIFAPDSCVLVIDGFCRCTSLCRIEIPPSVERIGFRGFDNCPSLLEVTFAAGSHVRELRGFFHAHHFVELKFLHLLNSFSHEPLRIVDLCMR